MLSGDERIAVIARDLADAANAFFVSSVSLWELAIKISIGKLNFDLQEIKQACIDSGFQELPVFWTHAQKLLELPPIHKDPFDRLLVAQALSEPMTLITADATVGGYHPLIQRI